MRGLCTDVWYIRLLGLNDKLCSGAGSKISGQQIENNAITTSKIVDGAVTIQKLSPTLQQFVTNTEQTLQQIIQQIYFANNLTNRFDKVGQNKIPLSAETFSSISLIISMTLEILGLALGSECQQVS